MRASVGGGRIVVLALTGLLLTFASPTPAHVRTVSGPFRVTIGWGNEPALTGSENFVDVAVSDASGAPVAAPGKALDAEVSFGDARIVLPLLPAERPGEFRAVLVPTRPGTYTFHITGTLKGRAIDAKSTCSDRTFDCVTPLSEVQFPVKDPSSGEVVQRLARTLPRAQRATDTADSAREIAIAAILLAALALAAGLGLGLRGRRKND